LVCLRLASSSLPLRAQLLLRWFSLLAAGTVRLSIIRGTAAITVILATRTTATTRATTATDGEGTTDLGGGIAGRAYYFDSNGSRIDMSNTTADRFTFLA